MIVRVVKMTFREDEIETFLEVFEHSKKAIRNFNGVMHLELLKGTQEENVLFTYSYWQSEEDLNQYRNSNLFKDTWAKTKPLFLKPAEAWSTERIAHLP